MKNVVPERMKFGEKLGRFVPTGCLSSEMETSFFRPDKERLKNKTPTKCSTFLRPSNRPVTFGSGLDDTRE